MYNIIPRRPPICNTGLPALPGRLLIGRDTMSHEEQLSNRVTQSLLYEIRYGAFSDQDTLPPEMDLAERYRVSRNIVRECLTKLEREGWLVRKRGVGTLINKIVVQAETRIDLNYEMMQTIEMSGKTASSASIRSKRVPAYAAAAEKLEIAEGDPVLRVSRVILADGKPAIFCIDFIPERLIVSDGYAAADFTPPIYQFLKKFCSSEVEISLAELRAMPVTAEVARGLNVPLTTSLLFISEVGYDYQSRPVLYSEEYFMDGVIHHMVVRKKI